MENGKITGLAHIGLFVSDITRTREFYENVLGFKCIFSYMADGGITPVAFEKNGSCVIEVVQIDGAEKREDGHVDHIALAVENIEDLCEQLRAKGIEFESRDITVCPECFPNGSKWILFRGPDNERLEIAEVAPY